MAASQCTSKVLTSSLPPASLLPCLSRRAGRSLQFKEASRRPSPPLRIVSQTSPDFSKLATAMDEPGMGIPSENSLDVEQSIAVLKRAAKTRKVPGEEVIMALCTLEKTKLDPSSFFSIIGGSPEAPGPRTWMLVFTSSKEQVSDSLKGMTGKGTYFPITAVQTFDATAMTIDNGVYLGPLGSLTFSGRLSWNKRILAFLFDTINIKIGSLGPFKFNIAKEEDKVRSPSSDKDPFFVWHYADEEITAARGRSGGLALWCRCKRVVS